MLEAIKILINGVWGIVSVQIPVSETISFTIWQYFTFIIMGCITIKHLMNRGGKD